MLSSTAKNIYWMGRYLQRAKSTARLIEATQRMALQSRGEEAAGTAQETHRNAPSFMRFAADSTPVPARCNVRLRAFKDAGCRPSRPAPRQ